MLLSFVVISVCAVVFYIFGHVKGLALGVKSGGMYVAREWAATHPESHVKWLTETVKKAAQSK